MVFKLRMQCMVYVCFLLSMFQPFLLGKAVLPLKQCLTGSQLKSRFVLDVKAPPPTIKGTARQEPLTSREEHIIGTLEVSIQIGYDV